MQPPHNHEVVPGAVHYYVAVRSSEESADPLGEAKVKIGPGCHDHLQQELDHGNISTFLASSHQDNVDVHNLYSILQNQKF